MVVVVLVELVRVRDTRETLVTPDHTRRAVGAPPGVSPRVPRPGRADPDVPVPCAAAGSTGTGTAAPAPHTGTGTGTCNKNNRTFIYHMPGQATTLSLSRIVACVQRRRDSG